MDKRKMTYILAIMACVIVASIIIQIKTLESANSPVLEVIASDNLRNEVISWKNKYDTCIKETERTEKKLTKLRTQISKNDSNFSEKEKQIKEYNRQVGLTDVSGEGIIINIGTTYVDETMKEYLDNILNELKNAGAEAISVNNQRIIDSSVVSLDGNLIKINSQKIESPFEIKAIGDTRLLYGAIMRPGGYIELLKLSKVKVDVKKSTSIDIEKYNGIIKYEYAKSIKQQ